MRRARAGQGVLSPLPTRPCPLVDPVRYAPLDHDAYILAIHAAWRTQEMLCYWFGVPWLIPKFANIVHEIVLPLFL